MVDDEKRKYFELSTSLRKSILHMIHMAGSGHCGGSLSVLEILIALYFSVMNIDAKNPKDPNRDRCVLSKGHAAPALYAVLAKKGFFPEEEFA